MDMEVVVELLSPGVEDCGETEAGSEVFGIGGGLQEGLGDSAEENVVNEGLVLKGKRGEERVVQSEDNVIVVDG
jgi:hypothetical protein